MNNRDNIFKIATSFLYTYNQDTPKEECVVFYIYNYNTLIDFVFYL